MYAATQPKQLSGLETMTRRPVAHTTQLALVCHHLKSPYQSLRMVWQFFFSFGDKVKEFLTPYGEVVRHPYYFD
ncbi:unnamed protein product [Sphagnum jensenii]